MEQTELQRAIEAILFAAGERVDVSRLCLALQCDQDEIMAAADALANDLAYERDWPVPLYQGSGTPPEGPDLPVQA